MEMCVLTTESTKEVTETVQDTVGEVGRMTEYLQNHLPDILAYGIRVLLALVVFFVGRIVIKWIRALVGRSFQRSGVDAGVRQFTDSFLKFALYVVLIFSIVTKLGVDTASVAAVLASAGVAIGLALQGSLANFAGGVLILLLKPFEVGDYIVEDTNKNEGTVKEIQIFYTKLSTLDNKTIVIPNGMLTNNSITNVTAKNERRLDLRVTIAYDSDLRRAKQLLEQVVKTDGQILQEEEILIFVDELGERGVVLGARAWVVSEHYWEARWRILENIRLAFEEHGVRLPEVGVISRPR
ncbi:mechanosensitive ion channel family protein [Suipraeoptans intestinalis]